MPVKTKKYFIDSPALPDVKCVVGPRSNMLNPSTKTGDRVPSRLCSILSDEIKRGIYGPSGRLPAERDLAERFGVSRTSVRECLNYLVKDGVVVRLVGKGTFVSQEGGEPGKTQEPVSRLAFLIGDNIFRFVQPGYTRILVGAEQAARQQNFQLLFRSIGEEENDPEFGLPHKTRQAIEGALVAGGLRKTTLERLLEWHVPVVLTDLIVENDVASAVGADYGSGTRQALEHLAALGHTRIGFIGFPNSEKYQAYWRTLERLDIAYKPQWVYFFQLPDLAPGIVAGYQAMQAVLASPGPRPTAILATNDLVALGAMEALNLAGIAVPDEMSVIGYDDLEGNSKTPLTTIRSFPEEVGRTAATMLMDRLSGKTTPKRVAIPTELVVRDTSGPVLRTEEKL
jgi:LacI family transcriptional regulator